MNTLENARLVDWVSGIDIQRLRDEFGSPAWIVSETQLLANVLFFERFTGSRGRILFPVKANPSLTVLQLLAGMGVGADCASKAEIDLARFAGIPLEHISYNTPVQDVELCKQLLEAGASVVMDDPDAILELQSICSSAAVKGKLLVRLNLPDYVGYLNKNENQELMAHGHTSSKFGIPVEDLVALLGTVSLPVSGLHVHVGTQMDNLGSFEFALNELNAWAESLLELGHPIREINIGGGLGIPFVQQDCFPSLSAWVDALVELKNERFNYSVEPGHALVGNAVALLMQILTVKQSRGKKWAIADVGTDQLTKITLLRWPHRILTASGEELPAGNDAIAGPLCFAGDILLENVSVAHVLKGSPLLLTEAGAYTYALSNRFNGRLSPQWLLIDADGRVVQTVRKEDRYENLQLANFEWGSRYPRNAEQLLSVETVLQLSSNYLRTTSSKDTFSYESVLKVAKNVYEFEVAVSSPVSFISMPFAIRIVGDAAIVAVLHDDGQDVKREAVWGRRLVMDCFGQVPSHENLRFTISLSNVFTGDAYKSRVVRFATSCGRCVGSVVVLH